MSDGSGGGGGAWCGLRCVNIYFRDALRGRLEAAGDSGHKGVERRLCGIPA